MATNFFEYNAKEWNKNCFGDIYQRKRRILARLEGIQKAQDNLYSFNLERLEEKLQLDYQNILKQEEILWYQKSISNWITLGDRNTKFFHVSTIVRRKRNRPQSLKNDQGAWVSGINEIKEVIQNFYKNLFGTENCIFTDFNQYSH